MQDHRIGNEGDKQKAEAERQQTLEQARYVTVNLCRHRRN